MDLNLLHFLVLALAAYRITRLLVEDTVTEPLRNRVWSKYPPESTKLGYLLTCYWCTGFWVSILLVGLYLLLPGAILIVALIFALSAVVGIIDTLLNK